MSVNHTNACTIWQQGARDQFGRVTWQAGVYRSIDQLGSNQTVTDSKGVEFVPKQQFWTRLELLAGLAFVPQEGDYIARGSFPTSTDPIESDAEAIRARNVYDNSMLDGTTDYMLAT